MRVFVTGATGFIGLAVVRDLLAAGHEVLGLARSDAAAASVAAAGAQAHRGSLEDLHSIEAGAAASDGVIHTAFDNTHLSRFKENGEVERRAIEAIGGVLEGTDRALVVTAGFASLVPGRVAIETDERRPGSAPTARASEPTALALAARGVRASVVRLPCVHGRQDRFTVPMFIDLARRTKVSAYVGDGLNRWPAVHNVDAAGVYRLALEAGAGGARYHAVAEEAVPFRAVAEVIGRRLGVPVAGLTPQEAGGHFGALAAFAGADMPASSALTREGLGWQPKGPPLLSDIDHPDYYAS